MEFVIKQDALQEVLGYVQGVVERRSTIPALSNILIESLGENAIRIVGTDLDVTVRCDAEAEIKTPGAVCVQARKLFDLARVFQAADVRFKKEDNDWVNITSGRGRFRLAGISREQFPEIPIFKSAPLKLPAEVFSHFIQHTAFAITTEQSRFTLSGAKFVLGDGHARMVTTDGHRLAYIDREIAAGDASDAKMDALIPKKALLELVKLSRDTGGDISFGEDQNHIYFELEGRLLISRKLSGNFPNYEMVMPKSNDRSVTFGLDEMKGAVRRVSLMADERNKSLKMTVREGEIELSAQSSEEGEGTEVVAAEYSGEETLLGFNWQYLQDFLNAVSSAEAAAADEAAAPAENGESGAAAAPARETASPTRIVFEFKDANAATQMSIAGDNGYDYRYIVMPLRI
jgi:DNA polymerase III subunit beta